MRLVEIMVGGNTARARVDTLLRLTNRRNSLCSEFSSDYLKQQGQSVHLNLALS